MSTTNKPTPGQWVQHGCTIYTADDWRDGVNRGGQWIAQTFQDGNDRCPTDEEIERCALIVLAVNTHVHLAGDRDLLRRACKTIVEIANNCLRGATPLIAQQTFGAPIRAIRRLALEALSTKGTNHDQSR